MNPTIRTTVVTAAEVLQQVNDFYKACGRSTVLEPSNQIVLAYLNSEIVGVVRLCFESDTYLLRTMQVREDFQKQGVGRLLLGRFDELLKEQKITSIYCMPYAHLENFYGIMGFLKIDTEKAPAFLVERVNDFIRRKPDEKVILMGK